MYAATRARLRAIGRHARWIDASERAEIIGTAGDGLEGRALRPGDSRQLRLPTVCDRQCRVLPSPDAERRYLARHGAQFNYQGNRNPFIDHPGWIACLFQNVCH